MAKVHEIKPEKVAAVADIVEKLKNAQSVTICSYNGLTVEQVTELRKLCRNEEVAYVVLKNRLVLRALNEVGITGLDDLLNGPNAFVFSMKDAVAGPRIINDYIEKNKLQDWTNAWDPDRESYYWTFYDTSTTPGVYLLDKDKKIIAKKIDAESLDRILNYEINERKDNDKPRQAHAKVAEYEAPIDVQVQ